MSCQYPKSARLRQRYQFQRMAQSVRHVGTSIIVDARPNPLGIVRLGITVTRHYGKAYERNRFKRVIREAFRLCRHRLKSGLDLNVKPRSASKNAQTGHILEELLQLIGAPPQ